MKKIMNRLESMIAEMCSGIVLAHPELELMPEYKVIKKKNINKDKVSLISGGGSGHEPAHAGFIGQGMLDAAVCGDVFASPSQIQIYNAIMATRSEKGTLLIIKNYSGDIMNFKNAAYMASMEGVDVDYIRVQDDIAVMDSLYTVGRRGVAGTVLVHKITGAAAERGMDLARVKAIGEKAAESVCSLGFALSSCTVPANGKPTFEIEEGEMEYGVGIHGEPGIKREKLISAEELCDRMTDSIIKELKPGNAPVAVLINGFGATPLMELYIMNHFIRRKLHAAGIKVYREFVGDYMTSIDMMGASLSIMKLDSELSELLDDVCDTPGLKVNGHEDVPEFTDLSAEDTIDGEDNFKMDTDQSFARISDDKLTLDNMKYIVDLMSNIIIENEIPFCELDSHAGDGDFGMSIAKGFRQVKREWSNVTDTDDIGNFLMELSKIIMEYCGGASGPIWGFAFLEAGSVAVGKKEISVSEFAEMLQAAVDGIQSTGKRSFGRGAQVGDKTLIDALVPCTEAWKDSGKSGVSFKEAFAGGAAAAIDGARKTEDIAARMGRAGNVGERSIGYPDAGAHALGVIFTQISNHIL